MDNANRHSQPDEAESSAPTPLREKAKAMYRQAVLDAAEQVFATQGFRGARIQDIAKRAGVSVGTVYNHFAQKEDILGALVADQELELHAAFQAQPEDPGDFEGALRARHMRVMRLIAKHRDFYTFALYEGIFESDLVPADSVFSTRYSLEHGPLHGPLEELLEQGMREGVVEPQEPCRLRHFYTGATRGLLMAAMRNPQVDPVEEGRLALELVLRAIRPVNG